MGFTAVTSRWLITVLNVAGESSSWLFRMGNSIYISIFEAISVPILLPLPVLELGRLLRYCSYGRVSTVIVTLCPSKLPASWPHLKSFH